LTVTIENVRGRVVARLQDTDIVRGTTLLKRGFAQMLKHGVVMDVTNMDQAKIAGGCRCCRGDGSRQASL
jgi:pyridoxal 5'-phosphate synthase pdxS subunit